MYQEKFKMGMAKILSIQAIGHVGHAPPHLLIEMQQLKVALILQVDNLWIDHEPCNFNNCLQTIDICRARIF